MYVGKNGRAGPDFSEIEHGKAAFSEIVCGKAYVANMLQGSRVTVECYPFMGPPKPTGLLRNMGTQTDVCST